MNDRQKEYQAFLESKIAGTVQAGIDVSDDEIHPSLFPHQRDAVRWALLGGQRAIFAAFGLGKTRMQMEMMRHVHKHTKGRCLIICPLGVKQEFQQVEGPALGINNLRYVTSDQEVLDCDSPYMITNYERVRDGGINPDLFTFASLDEASVLRSFGSKTYQEFLPKFANVEFRYVATATPSPNRYKELIHYAGFLGIMDTGQALTRFFQRDSTQANNLTIYPHKEKEFWLWIASWALFIEYPSDLGYDDDGYVLPEMNIHWHRLPVDHKRAWRTQDSWGQGFLFANAANGLKEASREKRETIPQRIEKAKEIIANDLPGRHWVIWHHLEAERTAISKAVPDSKAVYGSQDIDKKEELILGFSRGEYRILSTKPQIAGSGCNFQRYCSGNIFLGINYKFNDFIQAIHRTYRFQQEEQVDVHIIYSESEDEIVNTLKQKWLRHNEMVRRMRDIVKEFGLASEALTMGLKRTFINDRHETAGDYFRAINNDCIDEIMHMEGASVDMVLTSIPFSNQYEYTPSYNDFGHNDGDDGFFEQMDFLIPELLRVIKPGRVAAIHVKDRILFGNQTGWAMPTVNPFSDKTVTAFMKHGWMYMGRITIDTDVVRENNQTYRLGWTENSKDSTKMGVGTPEYVLLFRRLPSDLSNAYADEPVTKSKEVYTRAQWQIDAASVWRSSGDRLIDPADMIHMHMDTIKAWWKEYNRTSIYDYDKHVAMGEELEKNGKLPASFMLFPPQAVNEDWIWTDVNRMLTLNTEQSRRRNEMHVCPLQLDVIERLINRFTNPGEVVFDPFAGVFSVPYKAIKMDRIGWGTELSMAYWVDGVKYCQEAENAKKIPTLFDLMELEDLVKA